MSDNPDDRDPEVPPTAWSGVHRGPLREGEWVRLVDQKGRRHNFELVSGKRFFSNRGHLDHDELIGREEGFTVTSSAGGEYLVFRPLLSEFVVPHTARTCAEIFQRRIQQMSNARGTERTDLTYLGQGGRIWYMRLYIVPERRMHEVSLQEFDQGALVRRIDAAEATWDGKRWVFTSGVKRTFDAAGREVAESFPRLAVGGLAEVPDDFARDDIRPDEMNYFQLAAYITRLRSSGARVANYLVDLHMKLAFPVICLVVVLIGGALATRLRMQSAALGFGLSIAIAVLYYAVMRAGQALGHNGAMPPYAAAWMGDAIFGSIGIAMMRQAQRS